MNDCLKVSEKFFSKNKTTVNITQFFSTRQSLGLSFDLATAGGGYKNLALKWIEAITSDFYVGTFWWFQCIFELLINVFMHKLFLWRETFFITLILPKILNIKWFIGACRMS